MWALRRPILVHWATNRRWDRRAIARVASSDIGTVSTVIKTSSGEMETIIASTATTVRTAVTSWLIVMDSDDWTLSISLVTRLSSSPRWRPSKYDNGSRWILSSTSERNATMVRCTVTLSSRTCAQMSSDATR